MKRVLFVGVGAALLLSLAACRHLGCGKSEEVSAVPAVEQQLPPAEVPAPAPVPTPEMPK